jgi:hypothetical protein
MKKLFILVAFTVVAQTQAQTQIKYEFDEATETKCHKEIKTLGCEGPDGSEMASCLEQKKMKLTENCKRLHEERKSKQAK